MVDMTFFSALTNAAVSAPEICLITVDEDKRLYVAFVVNSAMAIPPPH